ncbi:MAG: hypothetical protein EZS28_024114, partial [Streblomastix strix]
SDIKSDEEIELDEDFVLGEQK